MNPNHPQVSSELAQVLRAGRDQFNAQFALARRSYGDIDAAAFSAFLCEVVDPLVIAVAAEDSDSCGPVTMAAYEAGLGLTGQRLTGPAGRLPLLSEALGRLLPRFAPLIAQAPWQSISALGNAVANVAGTPGARPERFVDEMLRVASAVGDLPTLLEVGKVNAWRSGLAHYRQGALSALAGLTPSLARAVLGVAANEDIGLVQKRLVSDPWFAPEGTQHSNGVWVGAFQGFGGLFREPPLASESQGQILVSSAGRSWLLAADAFGATFHRATDSELAQAQPVERGTRFSVADGYLRRDGQALPIAARGELSSVVQNAGSAVLSFSMSHSLLLLPHTPAS